MSDDYRRIEVITGTARRRYWSADEKLSIVEETLQPGQTVSLVARRHGMAPNLVYRWRRLMKEGGAVAVGSDQNVVGEVAVKKLEARVRELERMLGKKTMEVEILREALDQARSKKPILQLQSYPQDGSR
ncbi:IS 426 transposase [Parvularcula bermudensis HTCC2503]|uniref:IS 426 transposase n=1 Tax=Parvularcula bermudensis (strain ATCC BAA-594 / HTCC2503 / KCTC 12087) TaxID=314260 RepID=E0TAY0_PARBH|nr:IS 426 transposase [Parvularcula bermudensis HTCC2503]